MVAFAERTTYTMARAMLLLLALVVVCCCTAVSADDYSLTSNCYGYSWQGAACSASPADVTVPVGVHTVAIGGLNINAHPVLFSTSATTLVAWSGVDVNPITGNRLATVTMTVTTADIGTSIYYKCVSHTFFGKITFVASNTTTPTESSSTGTALEGTPITLSTCASDTGGSPHGYSWNGYVCSDNKTAFHAPVLAAGIYQVSLAVTASHPVIFTTDIINLPLWSGASPNAVAGLYDPVTRVITLDIKESDRGTVLYAYCGTHGFRTTLVLIAPSSSSSTGLSGSSTAATATPAALPLLVMTVTAALALVSKN